eukprot:717724-Rhodomonas_salina.1
MRWMFYSSSLSVINPAGEQTSLEVNTSGRVESGTYDSVIETGGMSLPGTALFGVRSGSNPHETASAVQHLTLEVELVGAGGGAPLLQKTAAFLSCEGIAELQTVLVVVAFFSAAVVSWAARPRVKRAGSLRKGLSGSQRRCSSLLALVLVLTSCTSAMCFCGNTVVENGCQSDQDWVDSFGNGCSSYEANPWWCEDVEPDAVARDGVDAGDVCCVCEGGVTEECDDGNTASGDGCDANCRSE